MSALTFETLSAELTQTLASQKDLPPASQVRCTLGRDKIMVLVEYPLDSAQAEPVANQTLDWLEQHLRHQFETTGLPNEAAELSGSGEEVSVQLYLKHMSESKPFTMRSFIWKVADSFDDIFGQVQVEPAVAYQSEPVFQPVVQPMAAPLVDDLEEGIPAELDEEHLHLELEPELDVTAGSESDFADAGLIDTDHDAADAVPALDLSGGAASGPDLEDLLMSTPGAVESGSENTDFSLPGEAPDIESSEFELPTVDLPMTTSEPAAATEFFEFTADKHNTVQLNSLAQQDETDFSTELGTGLDALSLDDRELQRSSAEDIFNSLSVSEEVSVTEATAESSVETDDRETDLFDFDLSAKQATEASAPTLTDLFESGVPDTLADTPATADATSAEERPFSELFELDSAAVDKPVFNPTNPFDSSSEQSVAGVDENAADREEALPETSPETEKTVPLEDAVPQSAADEEIKPPTDETPALTADLTLSDYDLVEGASTATFTAAEEGTEEMKDLLSSRLDEGPVEETDRDAINKLSASEFEPSDDVDSLDNSLDEADIGQPIDDEWSDNELLSPDLEADPTADLDRDLTHSARMNDDSTETSLEYDPISYEHNYAAFSYGESGDEEPEESAYYLDTEEESDEEPYNEDIAAVDEGEVQRQREQWQQQTKRSPWFFVALFGVLASSAMGFVLTRACVLGTCERIQTAQVQGDEAIGNLRLDSSLETVKLSQAQLAHSVRMLEPIPVWSRYHNEAQTLLPAYESQLSALDLVIAAQTRAYEAAVKSQNPPHPVSTWKEVAELWRQAIRTLDAVPQESPVRNLANRKLVEYRANLSTILVRIETESDAEMNLRQAQQAASRATQKMNSASSIEEWEDSLADWESAVDNLKQIPQGTQAYSEAQNLLSDYQEQLDEVEVRTGQELDAGRGLSEAKQLATRAKAAESQQQWMVALQHWKSALSQLEVIPEGTFSYPEAQILLVRYTRDLSQVENNQEVALSFQPIEPSFYLVCGLTTTQKCSYSVAGGNVRVDLFAGYDQVINQSITLPHNRQSPAVADQIVAQANQLLQQLTLLSAQAQIPVELYDAEGEFLARYRPDLNGFTRAEISAASS